jgi:predicted metalloprotease with PDZ domain
MIEATVGKPGGLATEALLQQLGFTVHHTEVRQLGLMFLDSGAPTLYNVLDNTPAGQCGLAPEDVIAGVNGFNYTSAGLAWAATQSFPVTLEVLRGHRRLTFTMTPAPQRKIARLSWNGNDVQAERLYTWLEQRFPLPPDREFKVDFYENFHGIETVM